MARKKWAERTRKEKWAVIGTSVVSVFLLSGLANAASGQSKPAVNNSGNVPTDAAVAATILASPPAQAAPALKVPVVATKTVTESLVEPYLSQTRSDPTMDAGTTRILAKGENGKRTKTYSVVTSDGVEQSRTLLSDVVTTPPVTEVTANGTKQKPACDPNYEWACVPIASDVDCAGGSGNGPAYVSGPVHVIGTDIYSLDGRDKDGIGCE